MRSIFMIAIFVLSIASNGQSTIDWDGKYELQFCDFQSTSTQIGGTTMYSLQTASSLGFSFYMSNLEFTCTKNFNSKVSCTFLKDAASLVAPDSLSAMALLAFARYEFDLSELYARKFRKKIYEEKDAFSEVSFFKLTYDEIQRELAQRRTLAGKETDLGRDNRKLEELHRAVLNEIEQLADYCKMCKHPKKKR